MSVDQGTPPVGPVPVPHPKQVRDVLLGLTGRDVEVGPGDPVVPGRDSAVVGVYVTDKLGTGALVACDLALAACTGGALGLVPSPRVEQALAADRLPDDLADNFAEVANVLGSVFDDEQSPHLTLHKVHSGEEPLPTDLASMLGYVVRRLDLQIDIPGYGGGRLSVVAIG